MSENKGSLDGYTLEFLQRYMNASIKAGRGNSVPAIFSIFYEPSEVLNKRNQRLKKIIKKR